MKKYVKCNKKQCLILLAAAIFLSLPLCTDFVNAGDDLAASLSRIRMTGEQMFSYFPLRILPFSKNIYGYSASVFLSNVFYFFPGLLYRIGINLQSTYKITIFLMNVMTAAVTYFSFRKMLEDQDAGMAASFLYLTCPCRVYSIYGSGNLNEVFALAFLPLALWGTYRLFMQKKYEGTTAILTIGYSMVLLAWPVYFLGAMLVFGLFFLITLRSNLKKAVFCVIGRFILCLIALNAWYVFPLIRCMVDVSMVSVLLTEHVREYAVYLSQYVKIFEFGGGEQNVWQNCLSSATPVGPGPITVFLTVFYLCHSFITEKRSKQVDAVLLMAGIIMLLSSNLFPWDLLQNKNMLFSNLLAMVQTPAKLAIHADLLLIVAAGIVLSQLKKITGRMVCLLNFLTVQFQVGRLLTVREFLRDEQITEVSLIGYGVMEKESILWRVSEGITLFSVIVIILYLLLTMKKKKLTIQGRNNER